MNNGDGPAGSLQLRLEVPGEILDAATPPAPTDKPVGVELPGNIDQLKGSSVAAPTFRNLAAGKLVRFTVGYRSLEDKKSRPASAEVVFDGTLAVQQEALTTEHGISFAEVAKLPLIVFGVGLLITILAADRKSVV